MSAQSVEPGTERAGRSRRGQAVLAVICAAVGLGIGSAVALALRPAPAVQGATPAAGAPIAALLARQTAPPFTLVDQDGVSVSLPSLRGHLVLLTFMDPVCTQLCPLMGRDIAALEQQLPKSLAPELLIVSVAPGRTRADVEHFLTTNLSTQWLPGWHWLLGPDAASLELTWLHWHIGVQATPTDINHDALLEVIDPHGYLRATFPAPLPIDDVVSAITTAART